MSDIKIYVIRQDREEDVMPYDVSSETSVGDLKSIIAAETDSSPDAFSLIHNNAPLLDDSKTLQAAAVANGDLLSFVPRSAASSQAPARAPTQAPTSQGGNSQSTARAPPQADSESIRQHLLQHPDQRQQVSQIPGLLDNLNNPQAFREIYERESRRRQVEAHQRWQQMEQLNDNVTEENQAKILEMIRQERIDKEVEETMLTNPEFFGRVTMLYVDIEINGVPVKAFVDSGAQATIMSPDCAERCGITHLIDRRWQSVARGVGTAKILGRVHRANVKIGHDEVPCSLTIMEGKDVDMLFGLDMLKRYQACIDLAQNRLVFPGGQSVPFLPESEIPKNFDQPSDVAASEPDAGRPRFQFAPTGSASASAPAPAAASASSSQPTPSNFQGQGHSLGAPSAPPTTASEYTAPSGPPPGRAAATASATSPPPSSSSSAEFPQKDIDALVGMGISRQQAVALLRACGGNVDMAAAAAFDMS